MPVSEGHVYRARGIGMDNPTLRDGPDKRVPPRSGRDKRVPPRDRIGGARLSCPLNLDGLSNIALRTRQARPAEGGPDKQVPPTLERGMLIVPVVLTT